MKNNQDCIESEDRKEPPIKYIPSDLRGRIDYELRKKYTYGPGISVEEDTIKKIKEHPLFYSSEAVEVSLDGTGVCVHFVVKKATRKKGKIMGKNKTLIIYNYTGVACDTRFPVRDIKKIHVCKYSGDEVVEITDTKGETHKYDSAVIAKDPRSESYYDGSFDLDNEEDIQNWINDESRNVRVAEWYKNIKKEKSAKEGKCSR